MTPRDFPDGRGGWPQWLASAPGRYLLDWEARELDRAVANVFGYYAVQLGMPALDALGASRMPHRIRVLAGMQPATEGEWAPALRVADYRALPFASHSIDLVVLAHQLELSEDPHQLLREVDRVLRPDGHLIVVGLNPWSLWGLRQLLPAWPVRPFIPPHGSWIAAPQVRDWIRLLDFEPAATVYGCYALPLKRAEWLARSSRLLERPGDRWWPVCGAAYLQQAVKRVHGMRLIGPLWQHQRLPVRNGVVASFAGRRHGRGV